MDETEWRVSIQKSKTYVYTQIYFENLTKSKNSFNVQYALRYSLITGFEGINNEDTN
jgi:hypothetical protein